MRRWRRAATRRPPPARAAVEAAGLRWLLLLLRDSSPLDGASLPERIARDVVHRLAAGDGRHSELAASVPARRRAAAALDAALSAVAAYTPPGPGGGAGVYAPGPPAWAAFDPAAWARCTPRAQRAAAVERGRSAGWCPATQLSPPRPLPPPLQSGRAAVAASPAVATAGWSAMAWAARVAAVGGGEGEGSSAALDESVVVACGLLAAGAAAGSPSTADALAGAPPYDEAAGLALADGLAAAPSKLGWEARGVAAGLRAAVGAAAPAVAAPAADDEDATTAAAASARRQRARRRQAAALAGVRAAQAAFAGGAAESDNDDDSGGSDAAPRPASSSDSDASYSPPEDDGGDAACVLCLGAATGAGALQLVASLTPCAAPSLTLRPPPAWTDTPARVADAATHPVPGASACPAVSSVDVAPGVHALACGHAAHAGCLASHRGADDGRAYVCPGCRRTCNATLPHVVRRVRRREGAESSDGDETGARRALARAAATVRSLPPRPVSPAPQPAGGGGDGVGCPHRGVPPRARRAAV